MREFPVAGTPAIDANSEVKCEGHLRRAVANCSTCRSPVCSSCIREASGNQLCFNCWDRRRQKQTLFIAAGVIVVVSSLLYFGFNKYRQEHTVVTQRTPTAQQQRYSEEQRIARAAEREPCDAGTTMALVEQQMSASEKRSAIETADRFFQKCGDVPRIRWITHEARRQLSEWAAAAEDAGKLIESDRYDTDYWWWRGQDWQQLGKLADAEKDFRMAFSLCEACLSTISLADVLEKQGRPCDAIYPLQEFMRTVPNANRDHLNRRIAILSSDGKCVDYLGKGRTTVPLAADKHARARVEINGKDAGTFIVDTGATVIAMSQQLANRVGVHGPFIEIVTQTANGFAAAHLGIADEVTVGGLRAKHVEVAVIDGGNASSLLGMSFLSRFDVQFASRAVTISERK